MPRRKQLPRSLEYGPSGNTHYRFIQDGHLFRGSCGTKDVKARSSRLCPEDHAEQQGNA